MNVSSIPEAAPAPQSDGEIAAPSTSSKVPGLCLELLAPRRKVIFGEPIALIASLRNCSPAERTVPDLLAPEYGFLAIYVARPNEKGEARWEAGVLSEGRGKRSRALAPGGRIAAWIPISADRRGWFLRSPGTYRARSELAIEGTRIASNAVSFEVVPSPTPADRRAAETLMTPTVARALALGASLDARAWSDLSSIVKDQPASRLAPYARLVMGITRTHRVFDPETKTFRKPDCPGAIEDLRWALERLDDPVFAATGTVALSECLEALGNKGAAREAFSTYYKAHPEARRLPGVEDMFEARQYRSN